MSIYKKIYEAKKGIGTILKDSKNPFFKSNYLSLNGLIDAIENVLVENELILLQPIKEGCVVTQLIDTENGEIVESSIQLPNIQDPQKLGSCITYYRRYTLQSLLGLNAEDDDGNAATKQVNKQIQTPKRLTADQVKSIPTSDKLYTLETVLNTYVLKDNEKEMIVKRIKELKK
jgi:hypothetical protein